MPINTIEIDNLKAHIQSSLEQANPPVIFGAAMASAIIAQLMRDSIEVPLWLSVACLSAVLQSHNYYPNNVIIYRKQKITKPKGIAMSVIRSFIDKLHSEGIIDIYKHGKNSAKAATKTIVFTADAMEMIQNQYLLMTKL